MKFRMSAVPLTPHEPQSTESASVSLVHMGAV